MNGWLVLTHLAAAGAGWLLAYVALPQLVDAREVDGHTVLELHHHDTDDGSNTVPKRSTSWFGVIALVAGAMLVVAGIQFTLSRTASADRERDDRAYSECLTDWADDLVLTIQQRTDAGARVAEAEQARDTAVDRLLAVVARARETPPRATEVDFTEALADALRARGRLDAEQKRYDEVKAANQYVLPRAVCER